MNFKQFLAFIPLRKGFTFIKNGECWDWTGKGGAPTRRIWRRLHGPITKGLFVCHTCDRPKCGRPKHLWLGTQKENLQDASRKGRMILSPEIRAKIGLAHRGLRHTTEARAKMSLHHRSHKHSAETKAKLSVISRGNRGALGHHHTAEAKAKISQARILYWKNWRKP